MSQTLTTRLYVGGVIAAGVGLVAYFVPRELSNPAVASALLAATVVLSVFKLRLPLGNGHSTMSMAYAVDFVALMVEGANLAMLLAALGVLIQCTVRVKRRQPIHRAAFSAAAVVIAVQLAGWGWRALGGSLTELTLTSTVLPLAATVVAYFIVNTGLVAGAIAVTNHTPARALTPTFLATAPSYLVSAVVAALVGLAMMHGVYLLLPIVASPLFVCYRAYSRRWADAMATLARPAVSAAAA
jgi:hypothetical protein